MLKINLKDRKAAPRLPEDKKIIPFITPFYRSALICTLKDIFHVLSERSECHYLKICTILAFKKTPSILTLCGGSGITAEQLKTVTADVYTDPDPTAHPHLSLADLLDNDP